MYVLEALTPKACQEDYSYERFELLGDAFLKYAVSLFLFLKFPEAHEGRQRDGMSVLLCMFECDCPALPWPTLPGPALPCPALPCPLQQACTAACLCLHIGFNVKAC